MHVATTVAGSINTAPRVLFDEDGFLVDHTAWSPRLAQEMADSYALGTLGQSHWAIIDLIREKYFGLGGMPPMRLMCRTLGVHPHRVKEQFGDCRLLLQISGLPNPGGEVLTYLP